ncbi:hypothetical protein FSP39_000418 [Pinctada imbricata]|uniref:Uncharacterized protein n=1 Tax=Pinctada imbricata TaxID=66713 RepID=A0AA89C009_PINIB|nr:hypothetical protein FSP39_000418 [Pinctada imbricata]
MGNSTKSIELLKLIYHACVLANDTSKNCDIKIEIANQKNPSKNVTSSFENGDDGAVLYIVAVLVFYSAGIVIMLIKYSKSERKQMEEEAALDFFFRGMPLGKSTKEHHVNSVAIRAFHTLTHASYESCRKNDHHQRTLLETDV